MKLISTLLTGVVIFGAMTAHADWGRDRGGSECQNAIRRLQYAQSAGARATQMVQDSHRICGTTNIADVCHGQISAAWQQSVRDIQDAEADRQRACR